MEPAINFAKEHFPQFVEKLKTLAKIPSVSFRGFPKQPVEDSAKAVAQLLGEEGLENVEVLEIPGAHPYVYGDWLHAEGKPTLLLYAHHDVQPPGRLEKWKTDPFVPVEKDGRLFGRGAADDKAGIIVHTSAIASYLKTVKRLPLNVKMIIEGEEETGSEHLAQFLEKYRHKLQADAIVLTDTENYDVGTPAITTSLRGIIAMEVEVKVMERPLHSGMFGGPGPDPVMALSKMLASLVDDSGRIAIDGIYDRVAPLTDHEMSNFNSLNYTDASYRKRANLLPGVELVGGSDSPPVKIWRQPAISINAIEASSRKSPANIINDSAWCKVSIRTVPEMDTKETERLLKEHLLARAPWGVKVSFQGEQNGNWWGTKAEGKVFEKAKSALSRAFEKPCVFIGQGGSIPFVEPFAEVLGQVPCLLIGVEDPYTNAHSENESVHLGDLNKSIQGAIYLYQLLSEE